MIVYEDLLERSLFTSLTVRACFRFFSAFSRVATECYSDAACGETGGHGAVLQESHGRSGTLAHH